MGGRDCLTVPFFLFLALISCASALNNAYATSKPKPQLITPKTDKTLQFPLGKIAFSLIPLTPESVGRRKTLLVEVVKGKIWTLDQLQGIINVNVPVRCVIVKLKSGGLFINNPVAPTEECVNFVKDLEMKYGKVKYIVLSSLALEHKGTIGAFSRYFPSAEVYVQPQQFSFPLNLPIGTFFPLGKRIREIPSDSSAAPWFDEGIDHTSLNVQPSGLGGYAETAFFHRESRTLLITDIVIKVPDEAPDIIQEDPRSILFHSRDRMLDPVVDNKQTRLRGWRRMVIFALTFNPSGIKVCTWRDTFRNLQFVSEEVRLLGEGCVPVNGGLYPWEWVQSEVPNFKSLQGGLLVAPILQKLLLNREPDKVIAFVNEVRKWDVKRIIPAHFSNDIRVSSSAEFSRAFTFLESSNGARKRGTVVPNEKDCQLLIDASDLLAKLGILKPVKEATLRLL